MHSPSHERESYSLVSVDRPPAARASQSMWLGHERSGRIPKIIPLIVVVYSRISKCGYSSCLMGPAPGNLSANDAIVHVAAIDF